MRTRGGPGGARNAAPGQGDTPTVARRGESPVAPAARPVRRGIRPPARFQDDSDTTDVCAPVPDATRRASRRTQKPVRFRSPDASEPTPERKRTKKLRARDAS